MQKKLSILFAGIIALALLTTSCGGTVKNTSKQTSTTQTSSSASTSSTSKTWTMSANKTYASAPPMTIDKNKEYTATIKTNYGDIVIQLLPKDAPLAVNNFVSLARDSFYNGIKFHRVIKNFMIQAGDPGNGLGGPGYRFNDEPITRDYVQGTLAMANAGANTNGSQFFITLVDMSGRMAKAYTIFGLVTAGFENVQKIGNVPVRNVNGELSTPTVDVHIDTITITEK